MLSPFLPGHVALLDTLICLSFSLSPPCPFKHLGSPFPVRSLRQTHGSVLTYTSSCACTHREGPVFITEYIGLCEGCVLAMKSGCKGLILIGSVLFVGVPLFFMFIASVVILLHVRAGNMAFEEKPKPTPAKEAAKQALKAPTLFGKIMAWRYYTESKKTSGEWVLKSDHAANQTVLVYGRRIRVPGQASWWNFLIGDFNKWWVFAIWLLWKKTLLTLLLAVTTGTTNAWLAMAMQTADTILVLFMKPYSEVAVNNNEIWSGVTNLFTFLNVTAPFLFGQQVVGTVVGNPMVSMFLSLLATAAAALTSILEMLEKVSVQLMAKLDYCMLPALPGGQTPNPAARSMELQAATAGLMASVVQVQEAAAGAVEGLFDEVGEALQEAVAQIQHEHLGTIAVVTAAGLSQQAVKTRADADLVVAAVTDKRTPKEMKQEAARVAADCYVWGAERETERDLDMVMGKEGTAFEGCHTWGRLGRS